MKRCQSCDKVVSSEELSNDMRCLSCQHKLDIVREEFERKKKFFPKELQDPYII